MLMTLRFLGHSALTLERFFEQSIGHVSGCHINPAVSTAMMITGKMSVVRTIAYILAQCLGGICGAALLQVIIKSLHYFTR